ncbi:hypothetical protein ACET3Z_024795 [Daucus carota]
MSQYEALAAEEIIKAVPEKVRNKTSDEADAANVERTHDDNVLESECVERIDNAVELESGKVSVDASTSKKRRLSSGDVYWERMLACMKGKVEDDDTLSEEEIFSEFCNELCRESDSENITGVTKSKENNSNDLFVPGRKDSKVSNRDRKRKDGGRGRSGVNWLYFLEVE